MNLLIDAQLPRRLAQKLTDLGHDAMHTLDLPNGNRTTDIEICQMAEADDRIVVSKDSDFVDSFHLNGTPPKLFLVSTGNISNHELIALFETNLSDIESALSDYDFIELSRSSLIIHA